MFERLKQDISVKIPRIGIIPSNSISSTKDEPTTNAIDENSEKPTTTVKDKGKGMGKRSNRAPKSSIEL